MAFAQEASILDVCTPSEFANGHLPGAAMLNYYHFDFRQKLLLLPKEQAIFLYCNTGHRSKRAAKILAKNGYKQIYNLENGIMEWNLNNLPLVIESNAKPDEINKMEPDEYNALLQANKPVFIDFYAPWCAPCQKMLPMIDSLQTDWKNQLTIVKINVDAIKKLVKELQLKSVPYFVFDSSGNKVFEHYGAIDRKTIEEVLKSY